VLPPPSFPFASRSRNLSAAFAAWDRVRSEQVAPRRQDIDPALFRPALANLVLSDVLAGPPLDFRYRLIGSAVRDRLRSNYTGRRFSEIEHQRAGSDFFENYARVVRERQPVFVDVTYVGPDRRVRGVQDLLMPLSDDGAAITGVLACVEFEFGPEWRIG
jgi:hypothetical protein